MNKLKSLSRQLLLAGVSLSGTAIAVVPDAAAQSAQAAVEDEGVVVTARRREERLQEVPISVSSITGARIEEAGIVNTQALSQVTPGLNFVTNGGIAAPNIRGIGTTNTNRGDEANVAMYVDGIYQPNMNANVFDLDNIARVEVLKGPQGTLFGRNATGGAINIITRTPSDEFSAELTAGVGSFEERTLSGYVTGALSSRVRADFGFSYAQDEGYIRDILRNVNVGNRDSAGARAKLVFDLTDTSTITAGAAYDYHSNGSGLGVQPVAGNTSERAQASPGLIPTAEYTTALNQSPEFQILGFQYFVRYEQDFESFSFSSQTSYLRDLLKNSADTDFSSRIVNWSIQRSKTESVQQEFLFSSNADSNIQWVMGLFALTESSGYLPQVTFTRSGANTTSRTVYSVLDTLSIAPFGEVTVPLSERFSITGGLRYTFERKEFAPMQTNGTFLYAQEEWTQFTPRVVLQYVLPDSLNIYASYSQGFKSGMYNTSSTILTPVDPEHVNAMEVGVKSLTRGPWRWSIAAFNYDYKDIQLTAFNPPASSNLLNAASARIYGVEAEAEFLLTENLRANASVNYTHGEYDDFPNAIIQTPLPQGGNATINNVDLSGTPVTRTPEWGVRLGLNYVRDFASGEFRAGLNVAYSSEFSWELANRFREPAHTLVNGSTSWSPEGGHLTFTLWGNNLTDEYYAISGNSANRGDSIAPGPGRAFGVRLGVRS